jgi:hypothetical protein
MNGRLMLSLSILACLAAGSASADDNAKPARTRSHEEPQGDTGLRYRVSGVRSSATLSTLVHCTNLGGASVIVTASFYEYTGAFVCAAAQTIASNGTRTLGTRDTAAFAEDAVCPVAPAPDVGQGSATISVSPASARIICSAEVVAIGSDPPVTLGALDIWPGN